MRARNSSAALLAAAVLGGVGVAVALVLSGDAAAIDDKTIFCSEYVPNAQAESNYVKWTNQNPGDRDRWVTFRDAICASQNPALPTMLSAKGKGLAAAGKMALPEALPPPTTTTTTTTTPPSDPTRYIYLLGTAFSGDASQTGWVRQYSGTSANVVFDPTVDVANSLGATSLKASIPPNDPCAGGISRAQVFSNDNIASSHGQPSFGMLDGQNWWYGLSFRTNIDYTPQNAPNVPNFNLLYTFHPGAPYPLFGQSEMAVWTMNDQGSGYFPFTDGKPRLGWVLRGRNQAGTPFEYKRHDPTPFVFGQRYVVQWRMKWSASGAGEFEIWVNGVNVVPTVTGVTNLPYGVPGEYPDIQNYRPCPALVNGVPTTKTNTVWYGPLIRATTRAGVGVP